ncbi:hypothetical protein KCU66_g59, partial [Aureobasidium melanogenum]
MWEYHGLPLDVSSILMYSSPVGFATLSKIGLVTYRIEWYGLRRSRASLSRLVITSVVFDISETMTLTWNLTASSTSCLLHLCSSKSVNVLLRQTFFESQTCKNVFLNPPCVRYPPPSSVLDDPFADCEPKI